MGNCLSVKQPQDMDIGSSDMMENTPQVQYSRRERYLFSLVYENTRQEYAKHKLRYARTRSLFHGTHTVGRHTDIRFSLAEKNAYESFMEYVVKSHLPFERSEKEVKDIEDAVGEYVDIISNYFKDSVGLEVCHKYLVGSMAEKTKIGEPDEFDFIFVLRDYTEDDVTIEVCTGCDKQIDIGTHPHLRMNDSTKVNRLKIEKCFYDIKQGINEEMKPLHTDSGILKWKELIPYHQGPAMTCRWEWVPTEGKKLTISADIVLAIERSNVTSIIDRGKISCEKYLPHLLKESKYFIIKQLHRKAQLCERRSDQFKFTFTTTEVKLINEVLSDKHKMCYQFLKFLYGRHSNSKPSSYQMKCLTLRHAAECEEHNMYMLDCTEDIMQRIVILFHGEGNCKPSDDANHFSLFLSDTKLSDSVNASSEKAIVLTTFRLKNMLRDIAKQWRDKSNNQRVFELLMSYTMT